MATVVLTVIGDDRAGLVNALSDVVAEHHGNWERSRMAELSGKFAGIVEVSVSDERLDELVDALQALDERGLLDIRVDRGSDPSPVPDRRWSLSLVGTDRPGIVRELSGALAAHGASIDELHTQTREAPMAGGVLFEAHATLHAPPGVGVDALRSALEGVADELMVDVELTGD